METILVQLAEGVRHLVYDGSNISEVERFVKEIGIEVKYYEEGQPTLGGMYSPEYAAYRLKEGDVILIDTINGKCNIIPGSFAAKAYPVPPLSGEDDNRDPSGRLHYKFEVEENEGGLLS